MISISQLMLGLATFLCSLVAGFLFGLVWIGSALALVAGIALGIGHVGVLDRLLLALAGGIGSG